MKKVITYGTYDVLHYGHIKLLERAKELGDYLIVGVTSDDYDKTRGKINNRQTLAQRIEAVKATGIADEVIVEEYEGQKIDDIKKYGIDIFTVGSDWVGKFDYLNDYCTVVYLPRTEGISSTEIRAQKNTVNIGIVGEINSDLTSIEKFVKEAKYINGINIACIFSYGGFNKFLKTNNIDIPIVNSYDELLQKVDAVYVVSHPSKHYEHIKYALKMQKHVLCESPISLCENQSRELLQYAKDNNLVLMEGIKTAYATAYERLLLIAKSGKIGNVISVDATCTSLKNIELYDEYEMERNWNTICEWGPVAMLPIFQMLGTNYVKYNIVSKLYNREKKYDGFTKIDFIYEKAVASLKIGKNVKSEGELIISGTDGYIYVPAPWWKTDYFELRYEDTSQNKRYFYQLDGEGIRYEISAFIKAIELGEKGTFIENNISQAISQVLESFFKGEFSEIV